MIQNRQRNRIFSIKTAEGERVVEQEGIERVLVEYHKGILTETQDDRGEVIEQICKEIPKLITVEQKKPLMRATTMEEVEEVVMNMKKGKAPGPDDFTVEFYQAGWHFMGQEILEAVEESRLKQKIWPVVTQEMIHSLNQKKQRGMMIKLDLSKAYDRLSWRYLHMVLEAYGFEKRWIEWIFSMISTPIFSILVNGSPTRTFNASRGIRQGDPISPFLFILAAEGLRRIIKREIRKKKIRGLKPWGNNLAITRQQFVDDIMLFGEVSIREVRAIKEVLDIFMEASGMEINKEKSCTFIFNTPEAIKAHLTKTLGFRQGDLPTKYLGNQLDIHPTRMKNWQEVIDKIKRRLTNWSFRSLNIASRIILLNSVLQSIPIYPLSIRAASKGVCTKLREIFGKFIWGGPK
eukprot:PITA_05533